MVDRKRTILALAVFLAIALLPGCGAETQKWILATFFDDVDTPPPPTHRVRRDLDREIEELKRKLAEAERKLAEERETAKGGKGAAEGGAPLVEKAKSWEEAAKILPKGKTGQVDWVQALKAGAIAPRPGPDPKAPEQAMLELDIELASSPNKLFGVTFSHGFHTRWLTCSNCHPTIFPLRQAKPTTVTMAKIQAGQYCGACHGRVAFSAGRDCSRCHTKKFPTAEWRPPEPRKPIEQAKNWDEAVKLLPVIAGTPDWAKALAEGVIAPRPGIDPKAEDQPVLPIDVERVPASGAMFKAIFPHQAHTAWLACPNCHTAIFQMAKGTTPITMAKINAGETCGICHGKVAFGIEGQCARCHTGIRVKSEWRPPDKVAKPIERAKNWEEAAKLLPVTAGTTDWVKALTEGVVAPRPGIDPKAEEQAVLPLDVELVPAAGEMFKVIFPHKTHTEWLGCPNCHTGIFQMAKGADPMTMEKINAGQYCGVCHGKVAFSAAACGRCHPAMGGGK